MALNQMALCAKIIRTIKGLNGSFICRSKVLQSKHTVCKSVT